MSQSNPFGHLPPEVQDRLLRRQSGNDPAAALPVNGTGGDIDSFFVNPDRSTIPRLAISLEGLDKRGKTHYALMTAPDPLLVLSDDPGTMFLARQARAMGRDVRIMEVTYPSPDPNITKTADVPAEDFNKWRSEWERVRYASRLVIPEKKIKTLVYDTGTGLWDLCVLAHFGKLKKAISQELRAECNSEFSGLFWELYKGRPDLNLIYLHRVKKQYVKSSTDPNKADWNGNYERQGYNQMGFLVDVALVTHYDGMRRMFYTQIDSTQATRYGAHLAGKQWWGTESAFYNLAMDIFPETELTPEVWGLK